MKEISRMSKVELFAHAKVITEERDDLIVKLSQTRAAKKSVTNKMKSARAWSDAANKALRQSGDYKRLQELTSAIYLNRTETVGCSECNPTGVYNFGDDRCNTCSGSGFIDIEK